MNDKNLKIYTTTTNLDNLILMLINVSGKFDVIILSETCMCIDFNCILNRYCT